MPIHSTRICYLIRRAAITLAFIDAPTLSTFLHIPVNDTALNLTPDQTDRLMIAQSLSGG